MHPEPRSVAHFFSVRIFRILAGITLALAFSPAAFPRPAENAPPSTAGPIYDSESFINELSRLKTQLEREGKSTETLRSFRESLPPAWIVETSGRRYDVPTDLLVSRLIKAERQPELRARQLNETGDYLDALAAETASLSGQPPAQEDSAKGKLDAILAGPEFTHNARQQNWWDRLRARTYEMILNTLDRIFSRVGGQKSLGQILRWLGVCAVAIYIACWIFRRWFRLARMEEISLAAAVLPARSWQQWVFAARDAARSGDYRLAVHCAYWAGIARLQDLGTLSTDRSKTPREYLRALTNSKIILPEGLATRQQALAMLTSRLENIWYGYQTATEADFRDSLTQLETLGCHLR